MDRDSPVEFELLSFGELNDLAIATADRDIVGRTDVILAYSVLAIPKSAELPPPYNQIEYSLEREHSTEERKPRPFLSPPSSCNQFSLNPKQVPDCLEIIRHTVRHEEQVLQITLALTVEISQSLSA